MQTAPVVFRMGTVWSFISFDVVSNVIDLLKMLANFSAKNSRQQEKQQVAHNLYFIDFLPRLLCVHSHMYSVVSEINSWLCACRIIKKFLVMSQLPQSLSASLKGLIYAVLNSPPTRPNVYTKTDPRFIVFVRLLHTWLAIITRTKASFMSSNKIQICSLNFY